MNPILKYAYYPGCVAKGACKELHASTIAIAQALEIELVELERASCCGSGTFKETDQLLEDTVNARNIAPGRTITTDLNDSMQHLSRSNWQSK
jgi:succinate dehydrogenase / fumarate reductase, cytochrome b subunit